MKALVIGNKGRFQGNMKRPEFYEAFDLYLVNGQASDEEKLNTCPDADLIIVDAICVVSKYVIDNMPNLKMIHSEGVGFNGIDVAAAKARKIPVCNCKGINAKAVAEQTMLLAIGLLRGIVTGDKAFREGKGNDVKENFMKHSSLKEIADCRVGLIGFGDISKEAAKMFNCFGAEVSYYDMFRPSADVEAAYNVTYKELDELARTSDILSIHVPATKETTGMINADLLGKMPKGSYFINTARGEVVNEVDLVEAIRSGHIAGAGLDTVVGEPITTDNMLLQLEPEIAEKFVFSCHVAGITGSAFKRGTEVLFNNVMTLVNGKEPTNVVNRW